MPDDLGLCPVCHAERKHGYTCNRSVCGFEREAVVKWGEEKRTITIPANVHKIRAMNDASR